jgi:hypothetical protein
MINTKVQSHILVTKLNENDREKKNLIFTFEKKAVVSNKIMKWREVHFF